MKIVLIGPISPYRGGIADTNESLLLALQDQGHELLVINYRLQYPELLFPGKTQYRTDDFEVPFQAVQSLSSLNPWSWWQTAQIIKKYGADLVLFRYWMPFFAPALGSVARLLGKEFKKVAICDNIQPHESKPGDQVLLRYFVSSMDAFMTLSQFSMTELDEFTDKPKDYFPHPINSGWGEKVSKEMAAAELLLDPDGSYLLFFGLIRKYKGLEVTLQALKQIKERGLNYKLIVAGEFYDEPDSYHKIVKDLGVESEVIFTDAFIPRDKVKYYFSVADLLLQNYHTATQSGITQLAYNFDCPVLVSDIPGLSEMVADGETGYVVPNEPNIIADKVEVYHNQGQKETFSRNIEQYKKQFSWENFATKLLVLKNSI